MIYKHKKLVMIQRFYINLINMFLRHILKLIASKEVIHVYSKISFFEYIRYELGCLEEKFQVHLERVESTGGQRRIKPTGLRYGINRMLIIYLFYFCSITDIIQQRLLNATDQVDESRFSPDLAAALLNDCKTAMNRITTVYNHSIIKIFVYFCFCSYLKEQMLPKIFFNVSYVY
jgi:hypothetical protein